MARCLLDELFHRVVDLGIEEWGGYRHVANITVEDGTGCNWGLDSKRIRQEAVGMGAAQPPIGPLTRLKIGFCSSTRRKVDLSAFRPR